MILQAFALYREHARPLDNVSVNNETRKHQQQQHEAYEFGAFGTRGAKTVRMERAMERSSDQLLLTPGEVTALNLRYVLSEAIASGQSSVEQVLCANGVYLHGERKS